MLIYNKVFNDRSTIKNKSLLDCTIDLWNLFSNVLLNIYRYNFLKAHTRVILYDLYADEQTCRAECEPTRDHRN